MTYIPIKYWNERFEKDFSLKAVGNASYGDEYNFWMYKRKDDVMEIIFYGTDIADKRVLDIGCGIGHWVVWFMNKSAGYILGVDISGIAIKKLRTAYGPHVGGSPRVEFMQLDITESYPTSVNDKFNIVNMWDIMPHIVTDEDAVKALKNIHSCMEKGGWLIISDQLGRKYDSMNSEHVYVRGIGFYDMFMPEIGFRQIKPIYPVFKNLNYDKTTFALDNEKGYDYYLLDSKLEEPTEDNTSVTVFQKI